MAYGSAKGRIFRGDIYAEDDPNQDTYIDWGNDFISFGVGGVKVLNVSASNTLVQVLGNVSASLNITASGHVSASAFYGDGSNLTGVTASAVNVADGPEYAIQWRYDTPASGDLSGSQALTWNTSSLDLAVTGNVRLADGYEFYGDIEGAVRFPAVNDEGDTISKGQAIYIKGVLGQTPTVALAACDDEDKMPAFGLAGENAANGAAVQIVTFGSLKNLNLTSIYGQTFAVGDTAYVQTGSGGTSGSLTPTRPTGSSNFIQNMGEIVRNGGGGDGQIKITGPGRANATPNLDKGYLFVGNDTNCSVQDNTVFISSSANMVGINNTNPDHALSVTGDISASVNVSASAFYGDGSNLTGVTASAVNVADGPVGSLQFRVDTPVTGEISGSSNVLYNSTNNSLTVDAGLIHNRTTVVTTYTASVGNYILGVTAVPTAILFDATAFAGGQVLVIKDESGAASSADTITLKASASQTIDGLDSIEIESPYGSVLLYSNGANWFIY